MSWWAPDDDREALEPLRGHRQPGTVGHTPLKLGVDFQRKSAANRGTRYEHQLVKAKTECRGVVTFAKEDYVPHQRRIDELEQWPAPRSSIRREQGSRN